MSTVQNEPDNRQVRRSPEQEEYRRRMEMKAKRRRKRQMQRLALLGAFALGAILLVVCIVMLIRSIFSPKDPKSDPASASGSTSISASVSGSLPAAVNTPVATDPTSWELILVNPKTAMPEGYDPPTSNVSSSGHTFHEDAAQSLLDMMAECNKVEGHTLSIYSAYRGATTQNDKHQRLVTVFKGQADIEEKATEMGMSVDEAAEALATEVEPAYPYSDHQTALGVDFVTNSSTEPEQSFASSPEYAWLLEHAAEYGFVLRFPDGKSAITGITYQPYHFRYVGVENAAAMNTVTGLITLEEYLMQLPDTAPSSTAAHDSSTAAQSGSDADSSASA